MKQHTQLGRTGCTLLVCCEDSSVCYIHVSTQKEAVSEVQQQLDCNLYLSSEWIDQLKVSKNISA